MAEGNTRKTGRLTDWIVLIFVLIVMGLLIADLGSNVMGAMDRDDRPGEASASAPAETDARTPTH